MMAFTSLHQPLSPCSYGDRVEHFRVLEGGGQYCIWDETFRSLNRLVDFYRTHSIGVEKTVYLRDPPSSPRLLPHPGCNPYPNPYKSSSQESLPSPRLYSHTSHLERDTSQRLLEPALGVCHLLFLVFFKQPHFYFCLLLSFVCPSAFV